MAKLDEVERTAVGLIRGAGRYGVYLTHLGFEVAGVADWLEVAVPRVRRAFGVITTVATTECERAVNELRGGLNGDAPAAAVARTDRQGDDQNGQFDGRERDHRAGEKRPRHQGR